MTNSDAAAGDKLVYLDPSGESLCKSPPEWFEKVLQVDKDGTIRGLGTKPMADGAFGKIFLLDAGQGSGSPSRSVSAMSTGSSAQQKSQESATEATRRILSDIPLLNRPKLSLQRRAVLKQMIKTKGPAGIQKNAALRKEGYMLYLVSENEMEYRNKFGTSLNPLLYGCWETEQHIYILMEAGPVDTLADIKMNADSATSSSEEDLLKSTEKQIPPILVKILLALRRQLFTVENKLRDQPIAHRDVKLHNILFDTESKDLMLVDWGSAATLVTLKGDLGKQHKTSLLAEIEGTRAYIAPEVLASQGVYLKEIIEEHPDVRALISPTLEFSSLETCTSTYNFQCDVWSVAVTVFLLQYGKQSQDLSPFSPPEWDMDCAEDFETYSNKELLRCMLDPSSSLKNAPEQSGKRFEAAEKTSLLPGLLRQMLRPNTASFQFIKPDHAAGDRGVTAEYRLTLDEVLRHPFCKASGANGYLELDLCNELNMAVTTGFAQGNTFSPAVCESPGASRPNRPSEALGDATQPEPIMSNEPDAAMPAQAVPEATVPPEGRTSDGTCGNKRTLSPGDDSVEADLDEVSDTKRSCLGRLCSSLLKGKGK